MERYIFDKFFSLGEIKVGPTICSLGTDGDWLGTVNIYTTRKNVLLDKPNYIIGVREFNNVMTEDLYDALKYLSIKKDEFDKFINEYYLFEWENTKQEIKPDVSRLRKRAYFQTADIEYIQKKLQTALRVPKTFLGFI